MTERGHRVRYAMELRGFRKQFSLAIDLGVDQSTLSRWSNGATLSLENAIKLGEVLDVSLDWLLLGRGEMEQHKQHALNDREWRMVRLLRALPGDVSDSLAHHLLALSSALEPTGHSPAARAKSLSALPSRIGQRNR